MESNVNLAWKKTKKRLFIIIPTYLLCTLYMVLDDYGSWNLVVYKCITLSGILIVLLLCTFLLYYLVIRYKNTARN